MSWNPRKALRGRHASARRGNVVSGQVPYGYYRDYGLKDSLIVDPTEGAVVRAIFALYLEWRSITRVRRWLIATGIKPRRADAWSQYGLAFLLRNDTYAGRVHFGTTRRRGVHPPLVSTRTFRRVQALLTKNCKRKTAEAA